MNTFFGANYANIACMRFDVSRRFVNVSSEKTRAQVEVKFDAPDAQEFANI